MGKMALHHNPARLGIKLMVQDISYLIQTTSLCMAEPESNLSMWSQKWALSFSNQLLPFRLQNCAVRELLLPPFHVKENWLQWTCPRSCDDYVAELGFEPRSAWLTTLPHVTLPPKKCVPNDYANCWKLGFKWQLMKTLGLTCPGCSQCIPEKRTTIWSVKLN